MEEVVIKEKKYSDSAMGAVYVNALLRALNQPNPYAVLQDFSSANINRAFILNWFRLGFNNNSINPQMIGWDTRMSIDFTYRDTLLRLVFTDDEVVLIHRGTGAARGVRFEENLYLIDYNGIIRCPDEVQNSLHALHHNLDNRFYKDILQPIEQGSIPRGSVIYNI